MELIERQKRYAEITVLMAKHDLAFAFDALGLSKFAPAEFQAPVPAEGLTAAERGRRVLEELGPTFVKMGQILSTRPDLLPMSWIAELKRLQDHVSALPFADIRGVIEAELGGLDAFASVEASPLAAASIGQVHRVVLKDGTPAVVKVQRPGIEDTIRRDLAVLRGMAELARATGALAPIDPVAVLREFERSILRELDYVTEARATDEFREQHAADAQVLVPRVFWDHTTKRVLTLEFVDGVKVSEVERLREAGHDTARLARKVVDVVLSQVFVYGRFHADPHPGNLMVLADGRLALIDFGMSGRFDRHTLGALGAVMRDLAERDHRALAGHFLQHGLVGYDADLHAMQADLREMFRTASGSDMHAMMELLMGFVVRYKVAFPPDLFFLDKVFGTLDGAVRTLDPKLDASELMREFLPRLAEKLADDWQGVAQRLLLRILESEQSLVELPVELGRLVRRADAGHLAVRSAFTLSEDGVRQLSRLALQSGLLGLGLVALAVGGTAGGAPWIGVGAGAFTLAGGWLFVRSR